MLASPSGDRSPLRGPYLVRNPLGYAWLRAQDAVLRLVVRRRAMEHANAAPRRILIAVGGQLGDAVLATSVLAPIRAACPGAQLGVLTGSWNRPVFASHPAVTWLHVVDQARLIRDGAVWPRRLAREVATSARAIREIRAVGYDVAIDLYPYYPNASWLLYRSRIPVRVGYASGGRGRLYTTALPFIPGRHVAHDHLALLRVLVPSLSGEPRCDLEAAREDDADSARAKLRDAGVRSGFAVLHMGAGTPRKEWSLERWAEVARAFLASSTEVVLTGAGDAQRAQCVALAQLTPGVANLCGRLRWQEFQHVVASARVVVSVDTVAAHLAAASGVPYVAIMSGMDDPARWRPLGRGVLLSAPVPCAPCYRSRGCAAMSCVRDVTVPQVLDAARALMAAGVSAA